MKSSQRGRATWKFLGSLRLSVALLSVLILLFAIGSFIAQEPTSPVPLNRLYSPDLLYRLKVWGFTDIYHSAWFVIALGLGVLNILAMLVQRLPEAWNRAFEKIPPLAGTDQHLVASFPSPIGREQFREYTRKWCRGKLGKVRAVRDEGGLNELQLAAERGRFSQLGGYLAHLALLVILAGALVSWRFGFEARVDLDEGHRVDYLEVVKGKRRWPALVVDGKPVPHFFKPGFEIECPSFHADEQRSRLNFYEGGKLVQSLDLEVNSPGRFGKMRVYQAGSVPMNQPTLVLDALDRREEVQLRLPSLNKGQEYEAEGFKIRILDIELEGEMRPQVQLQYTEQGKPPETFWIFKNHPSYDAVKRKDSRFAFAIHAIKERYGTSLLLVEDPGLPWLVAGALLLLGAMALTFHSARTRYWFVWGRGKVTVAGWSNKPFLLEGEFERFVDRFRKAMPRSGGQR